MNRLTEKQYWEDLYRGEPQPEPEQPHGSGFKRLLKKLMGRRLMDLISPYDDFLLWKVIFPRYLPPERSALKAVEIGSAPGDFLVRFAQTFGIAVYGVEYTRRGAERNRHIFAENNIDSDHVLEADFFSADFLAEHAGTFDVVISRGFIEHFTDVEPVISRHSALLRPGGMLCIMIPNLHGVYGAWTKTFNPDQMPLHNLAIMKLPNFCRLFENQPLETLRCGHFGTFSFWLFTAPAESRWVNRFIHGLIVLQRGLNLLFRIAFGQRGFETAGLSPGLLFVGRKLKS